MKPDVIIFRFIVDIDPRINVTKINKNGKRVFLFSIRFINSEFKPSNKTAYNKFRKISHTGRIITYEVKRYNKKIVKKNISDFILTIYAAFVPIKVVTNNIASDSAQRRIDLVEAKYAELVGNIRIRC